MPDRSQRDYRGCNTHRWLKLECLENRCLLALTSPFELSSLFDGNSSAGVMFENIVSNGYGVVVSSAGDFNGDGTEDLLIGAPGANHFDGQRPISGLVHVVFGTDGASPHTELSNLSGQGVKIFGGNEFHYAGISLASLGDFNGDGFDDVILGARSVYDYDAGSIEHKAYIVFGSETPPDVVELDVLGDGGIQLGAYAYDYSDTFVSGIGDVNGDGLPDEIIGDYIHRDDFVGSRIGKAHVVFGAPVNPETIDLDNLDQQGFTLLGVEAYDQTGFSVAGVGDINGDGIDDLGIGANYSSGLDNSDSYSGEVYVVFGSNELGNDIELGTLNGGGLTIYGPGEAANAGHALSGAGDVNGDGINDLIIGAPSSGTNPGIAFVVFGSNQLPANIELSNLGDAGIAITGALAGDQTALSVSGGGDINGDGFADVFFGAPLASPYDAETSSTREAAGITYLLLGAAGLPAEIDLHDDPDAVISILGIEQFDYSGVSIAVAGDINGDGADDLLLNSNNGLSDGEIRQAFLIFGEPTLDFGDATGPGFPTLIANDGARHVVVEGFHLGNTLDGEVDGQPTALADGDGNDEDGVTPLTIFGQGLTSKLSVDVSAGGFLDIWVDANNDGTWDHDTESVGPSLSVGEGENTIFISLPDDGAMGQLATRFRFSSAGSLLPTGLAEDGEVEDYLISVGPYPYHNTAVPTDVNGLLGTTVFDALLIINELEFQDFHDAENDGIVIAPLLGGSATVSFFDVNLSKSISPYDALLVLNSLDPLAASSNVIQRPTVPDVNRPEPPAAARFALAIDAVMSKVVELSGLDPPEDPPLLLEEGPTVWREIRPSIPATDRSLRPPDHDRFRTIARHSAEDGNDSTPETAVAEPRQTWQLE